MKLLSPIILFFLTTASCRKRPKKYFAKAPKKNRIKPQRPKTFPKLPEVPQFKSNDVFYPRWKLEEYIAAGIDITGLQEAIIPGSSNDDDARGIVNMENWGDREWNTIGEDGKIGQLTKKTKIW